MVFVVDIISVGFLSQPLLTCISSSSVLLGCILSSQLLKQRFIHGLDLFGGLVFCHLLTCRGFTGDVCMLWALALESGVLHLGAFVCPLVAGARKSFNIAYSPHCCRRGQTCLHITKTSHATEDRIYGIFSSIHGPFLASIMSDLRAGPQGRDVEDSTERVFNPAQPGLVEASKEQEVLEGDWSHQSMRKPSSIFLRSSTSSYPWMRRLSLPV